jgi:GST-like protein
LLAAVWQGKPLAESKTMARMIKRSSARSVRSSKRAASPAKKQSDASVKRKSAKATARAKPSMQRPIELFYWPTPNGWKISIMLEECRLPYVVRPVNIAAGEQFAAEFLAISPNNRMPAIVDPQGPGGRPISVFESGAILQYLGRKTGKFYPANERGRVEVEQWLMWQMGGLGPMAGQAHHFRNYAAEQLPYAIERYTNECNRLYGVMNLRLKDRPFLAGKYSIADMACIGWISRYKQQGQDLDEFPHLKRWFETLMGRPAVKRGMDVRVEAATQVDMKDPKVRAVLFTQRARTA